MAAARPKRVLIIDGHPDRDPKRLVHGLADAYRRAAEGAGHDVRTIRLCDLDFPWLRSAAEFAAAPPAIVADQQDHVRYYRAHSLKSLERNILAFVGIKPVRATLLGNVDGQSTKARARSIADLERQARLAR